MEDGFVLNDRKVGICGENELTVRIADMCGGVKAGKGVEDMKGEMQVMMIGGDEGAKLCSVEVLDAELMRGGVEVGGELEKGV